MAIQENGCSCSYLTLATSAVQIYYQINAKTNIILIFHTFRVRVLTHQWAHNGKLRRTNASTMAKYAAPVSARIMANYDAPVSAHIMANYDAPIGSHRQNNDAPMGAQWQITSE